MQNEVKFFIGANNTTGVVEIDKLQSRLGKFFDGWFITMGKGAWLDTEGRVQNEESVMVIVYCEDDHRMCRMAASILAQDLDQQSVGLVYNNGGMEYISPGHFPVTLKEEADADLPNRG